MKYIIKDWAGNVMNWGEFSCLDLAEEAIAMQALADMNSDGIDTRWTEDREDGTEFDERLFEEYCGEYFIHEIEQE